MSDVLLLFTIVSVWIAVFQSIVIMAGAIKFIQRQNRSPLVVPTNMENYPTVTVMVPAHNEELVIATTVERIFNLNYPPDKIQVIVIADNCSDRTADKLKELRNRTAYQGRDFTIFERTGKGGKSGALNDAFELATGEWICIYDADAAPERNALAFLVQKALEKPELYGAVFGRNKPRNRNRNFLTKCINLEIITSQRIYHTGMWELFKIGTIPGTNFIMKADLIRDIGGFDTDAITEDTAISFEIMTRGKLIALATQAEAYQQEPEKLSVYMKQRQRWAKGNYDVVIHNIRHLFHPMSWRIKVQLFYYMASYFWFLLAIVISDIIFLVNFIYRGLALFDPTIISPFAFSGTLFVFFVIAWALMYFLYVLQINLALATDIGQSNVDNFIVSFVSYFTYSQLFIIISLRAFYSLIVDKLFGRKAKWYKTERFG